ncbi:MAG: pitrilysin family protein [Rickettsiales bacterium]
MKKTYYVVACIALYVFSARSAQAMDIEKFDAGDAGSPVYFVRDAYAPIVSVMVAFDKAGYAYEPKTYLGIGALTLEMLEDGAGTATPHDFQRFLDKKHASVDVSADVDALYLQVTALSTSIAATLEKIASVIAAPAYDNTDFARYVSSQATEIKAQKTVPSSVASQKLAELIYPNHPYGRPSLGDGSNIGAYSPSLAAAYHKAAFSPSRAYVGVAGDVSEEEAKRIISEFLTKIGKSAVKEKAMALAADVPVAEYPIRAYSYTHIVMPGKQTAVAFALPGATRDDPRFFEYYVANYMLGGGGFESHLMDSLREKQGLAYGVGTALAYHAKGAAVVGAAATSPEKLSTFMDGLRKEISLPKGKEREEASEVAQEYLRHSFTLSLAKDASVAAMLAGLALYDLPTDYLQYREKAILAAKADKLAPILDKEWTENRLIAVSVGPESKPNGKK